MHRIKKILYYLLIIIGFALCFIFGKDKINILAFQKIDNTLGSYPIQLDIDNYNMDNLLIIPDVKETSINGITYSITNGIITINGSSNGETILLEIFNKNYNIDSFNYYTSLHSNINTYFQIQIWDSSWLDSCNATLYNDTYSGNCTLSRNGNIIRLKVLGSYTYNNVKIIPMVTKNTNYDITPAFKFGYYLGYDMYINNNNSSSISTDINIYNNDEIITSGTCTIPGNTNNYNCGKTIYSSINGITSLTPGIGYIPFTITNEGYITFNSNFKVVLSNSYGLTYSNNLSSQIVLQGTFNAYYKGNPTNNLYYKNVYLFNSWYISASVLNANNDFMKISYNDFTNGYTGNYESIAFVNANESINVGKQNIVEIGYYSSNDYSSLFDYRYEVVQNIFIDSSYLNCSILFSDVSIETMNNTMFSYNFSNILFNVANSVNGSIISGGNNSDIYNKKNTCSGWYDIPCQLGNAITYVIYEAPIISPIIEFFDNFIDLMQNLVSYITWFEGLGIIFSVFIAILMIRMIILLVKGGNDD